MTLPVPHPRSATLDHVIPRAHGGSDHRDNLQLAHLECNQVKADALPSCGRRDVECSQQPGPW
jgi:5-methylcytosine-specific restriction endonuclease McrA